MKTDEGYCAACAFIIPLTPGGRLSFHRRGASTDPAHAPHCKGSLRKPADETPTEAPEHRFSFEADTATCLDCHQPAPVEHRTGRKPVFGWHLVGIRREYCYGTGKEIGRRKVTPAAR